MRAASPIATRAAFLGYYSAFLAWWWIAASANCLSPHLSPAAFEAALREKQELYYLPAEEQADLEFLGNIQQNGYALSFDPTTRLEGPVLIVTGRQDTITGYADAWPLLEDYPHATYAVLDQADHDLPVQYHRLYHALVADWLDRLEHPGA